MPKILFIQPTQYARDGKLCKQKRIHLPGLAFPLLASYTPDNWEIDLRIEVVDDIPFDSDADLIAIGTMGHTIFRGLEIANEFKKRNKTIVMGGYMASMAAKEAIKHVDSVLIGDGEIAYPRMLNDFERTGKLNQIYEDPIYNLDTLPIPRYSLLIEKPIGDMLPVQAGRGCQFNCSFCSIACLYKGKYLFRPVHEVMRDIKVIKELGFNRFFLIDDNIASNPKYLEELCKEITPLKMKWASQCTLQLAGNPELLSMVTKSGCDLMSFGVESINQESLNEVNKSWIKASDHAKNLKVLSQAGIAVSTEMIIGTDSDTSQTIKDTLQFINDNRIPLPRFYILLPIPGSELFSQIKKEGRLLTENFKEYDGSKCVHYPKKINPDVLNDQFWWLNRNVFSFKSIVHRTLFNKYLWKNPKTLMLMVYVNLHYRKYIRRKIVPNIY